MSEKQNAGRDVNAELADALRDLIQAIKPEFLWCSQISQDKRKVLSCALIDAQDALKRAVTA